MLELVVVLAILAVMTSVSLSFMGEKDENQRYQASLTKLKAVERGFLSVREYQGQTVVSGFLVDNGLLHISGVSNLGGSINALLGYQNLPTLMAFSSVAAYVNVEADNTGDADVNKVLVNGSHLFKGVRPGLFDLSEYRDSGVDSNSDDVIDSIANVRGTIKDGWGEDFEENLPELASATSANISVAVETYKSLPDVARTVFFLTGEFSLPISTLSIGVNNLPDTTTQFKVALVSFNNEVGCANDTADVDHIPCWHTVKTVGEFGSSSASANTFLLTQTVDPAAIYDDSILTVGSIVSALPQAISELTFNDTNGDSWMFSEIASSFNAVFSFPPGSETITAGSHLLVLLCNNTTAGGWEVYSPAAGCDAVLPVVPAVDPVIEYLHLLPGVLPDPIILEIE